MPSYEDPQVIIDAVVAGMRDGYEVIQDRRSAIQTAIKNAAANDVVLVAGKGAENFQVTGDRREAFVDAEVAAQALEAAS